AVLPRVQDEHVEEPAPLEPTVQPSGLLRRPGDGPVIEERLPSHGHQRLAWAREVVSDLVIVPDRQNRSGGVERGRRRILAILTVFVVVAGERRRDKVGARDDVGAATTMIGIDRVADEEEEVRTRSCHPPKDLVAALQRAAELSTAEVAAPYETHASHCIGGPRP